MIKLNKKAQEVWEKIKNMDNAIAVKTVLAAEGLNLTLSWKLYRKWCDENYQMREEAI